MKPVRILHCVLMLSSFAEPRIPVTKSLTNHHYVISALSNLLLTTTTNNFQDCQLECINNEFCGWLTYPANADPNIAHYCSLYAELIPKQVRPPTKPHAPEVEIAYVLGPRSVDVFSDTNLCSRKKEVEGQWFCVISPAGRFDERRSFPILQTESTICTASPFTLWDLQYQSSKYLPQAMNQISLFNTLVPMLAQQPILLQSVPFLQLMQGVGTKQTPITWQYNVDKYGRVVDVESEVLDSSTILPSGARDHYCPRQYNDNFLKMMSPLYVERLEMSAGHIIGCLFTNPQGMMNFVSQTKETNAGCYKGAESAIAAMIRAGCRMTVASKLTYSQQSASPAHEMPTTAEEGLNYCRSRLIPTFTNFLGRIFDGRGNCEHIPSGLGIHGTKSLLDDNGITRAILQWLVSIPDMNRKNLLGLLQNELGLCENNYEPSSIPSEVLNIPVSNQALSVFIYFFKNGRFRHFISLDSTTNTVISTTDVEMATKISLLVDGNNNFILIEDLCLASDFEKLVQCDSVPIENLAVFEYEHAEVNRIAQALNFLGHEREFSRSQTLGLVQGKICTYDRAHCAVMAEGLGAAESTSGQSMIVFTLSYIL